MTQSFALSTDRNARLRVASYNIRKGVGLDWQRQPRRVVEVMGQLGADVIALQEVDRRLGSRRSALSPALLAEQGWSVVAPDPRGESLGWHGNAILARSTVSVLEHQSLDLPCLEPRGAVSAVMESRGQRFRLVGVHLSLSRRFRQSQIRHIVRHLDETGPMPSIILGDFNEWRGPVHSALDFGQGHVLHLPGRTFHSSRPSASLDRIVTSGGAHVEASGVNRSDLARRASDHLPIWADVTFDERPA
jgi:endonuclease/exonuclease/phosphatase family metal-dependent hydrolase